MIDIKKISIVYIMAVLSVTVVLSGCDYILDPSPKPKLRSLYSDSEREILAEVLREHPEIKQAINDRAIEIRNERKEEKLKFLRMLYKLPNPVPNPQ